MSGEVFFRPGDLVYDVGANMGNRTAVFYKLGARVVAFELQAYCPGLLRRVFTGYEQDSPSLSAVSYLAQGSRSVYTDESLGVQMERCGLVPL